MDFTLTPNSSGTADLSFDKSQDLFNNVYLSLEIPQGSWWFDLTFGLKKRRRLKNTPATANLLKQDCQSALQWLLDSGRATAIVVTPYSVDGKPTWLRMVCEVTGANGESGTYDKFIEVV